ncbi:unnamed protein product [Rhizopus microsporus]
MTEKENKNSFFSRAVLSTVSSGLTSFSQTLQTKSLPDLSKQLNKLQQQAKELPKQLGSLQQEFETERASFLLNKQKQENVVSSQAKGAVPVAPWVGYKGYERQMKAAIMEISKEKRNFLVPPPDETNVQFDFNAYSLTAHAALQEDQELSRMRFSLVPQHVNEETFWRNYFYRVTLIKQEILSQPPEEEKDHDETVLFSFQDNDDNSSSCEDFENEKDHQGDKLLTHDKKEDKPSEEKKHIDEKEYEGMEDWEIELRKAAI